MREEVNEVAQSRRADNSADWRTLVGTCWRWAHRAAGWGSCWRRRLGWWAVVCTSARTSSWPFSSTPATVRARDAAAYRARMTWRLPPVDAPLCVSTSGNCLASFCVRRSSACWRTTASISSYQRRWRAAPARWPGEDDVQLPQPPPPLSLPRRAQVNDCSSCCSATCEHSRMASSVTSYSRIDEQ